MSPNHGAVDLLQRLGQTQVRDRPGIAGLQRRPLEHVEHPADEEDDLAIRPLVHRVNVVEVGREVLPQPGYLGRIARQKAFVSYSPEVLRRKAEVQRKIVFIRTRSTYPILKYKHLPPYNGNSIVIRIARVRGRLLRRSLFPGIPRGRRILLVRIPLGVPPLGIPLRVPLIGIVLARVLGIIGLLVGVHRFLGVVRFLGRVGRIVGVATSGREARMRWPRRPGPGSGRGGGRRCNWGSVGSYRVPLTILVGT